MTKLQELKVVVDNAVQYIDDGTPYPTSPANEAELKALGLDARIGNFGIVFLDSQPEPSKGRTVPTSPVQTQLQEILDIVTEIRDRIFGVP